MLWALLIIAIVLFVLLIVFIVRFAPLVKLIHYSGVDLVNMVSRGLDPEEFMELFSGKMVEKGILLNHKGLRLFECFEKEGKINEEQAAKAREKFQPEIFSSDLPEQARCALNDLPEEIKFFLSLGLFEAKIDFARNALPEEVKKDPRYSRFMSECALFVKMANVLFKPKYLGAIIF